MCVCLSVLQERDGMRSILESYDSELSHTDYSPQLSKRLREAEDILQKTQSHHLEMEVQENERRWVFNTFIFFIGVPTNGDLVFWRVFRFFY